MSVGMNPEIQKLVRNPFCEDCKLSQQAVGLDRCVTAEGATEPELLIVGKLPLSKGQREELHRYLNEAGIDPETTAYTSVNKCRTWDIVANKKDQKACSPYLALEIEHMKPKMILALGNEALSATVGRSGIMKYRGQEFEHASGARVVTTISPSMVNRNPGQRSGFIADLVFARRLLGGEGLANKLKLTNLTVVKNKQRLVELIRHLRNSEGVAFDIETNGFDEFKPDSQIVSVSLTTWQKDEDRPTATWVIPLSHPQSPWRKRWESVLRALDEPLSGVPVRVAHNGKFDCRWLRQFGCHVSLTFDTMLAAHMLDENRPKGLKPLAQSLLGVGAWDISTKNLLEDPLKQVLKYNAYDTFYTAHLYFIFRDQLEKAPHLAKLLNKMSVPASEAFTDIERRGIWVDVEKMNKHADISRAELKAIDDELMTYVPDREHWPEGIKGVNFNPSKFARWLLFDYLKMPILERGKDKPNGDPGDPSMAEAVMQRLQRDRPHRVIDLMLARTKWQKYSSAFFSAYQEQVDSNDRIHTTFKLTGTVTGRLSSGKGDADKVTGRVQNRGVNLQQVPRDDFVRGIFGAPPGSVFIECDYSQIELRVAAFLAREDTMLHLYRTGQDIHTNMAMRMTNKPASEVTKDERKKAKAVNFGFLYGMGARKFVDTAWSNYGVEVSEEEAHAFRRAFFDEFPKLHAWHNRQRSLARKNHRVQSPIGRARNLPDVQSPHQSVKAEAERQAINSPVQSFASDMAILALVILDRQFRKRGLKTFSVGTVHDAINFEAPIEELPIVIPLIKYVMENVPMEKWFGVKMDVPIVADVAVGSRWGGAQELDGDLVTSPARLREWIDQQDFLV